MKKVTKIILATSLIVSFSSVAMAATHKRSTQNNDINGIRFLLGGGVGTGLSAKSANGGVLFAPNAGLDARLKLGTGIFTTTRSSTLGIQVGLGVGANSIGTTSSFNPQYSLNLDFIQAFKIGSTGYVKLGYILGAGVTIRTNDAGSNGSGNHISDSVVGAAVWRLPTSAVSGTAYVSGDPSGFNQTVGTTETLPSRFHTGATAAQLLQALNSAKQGDYAGALSNVNGNINSLNIDFNRSNGGGDVRMLKNFLDTSYAVRNYIQALQDGVVNNAVSKQKDVQALQDKISQLQPQADKADELQKQADTIPGLQNKADKLVDLGIQISSATLNSASMQQQISDLQPKIEQLTSSRADLQSKLEQAQQQVQELNGQIGDVTKQKTGELKAANDRVTDIQSKLDDVNKQLADAQAQVDDLDRKQLVAANRAKEEQDRLNAARANNQAHILPTLKAGLIAFFGKHQAVSLEYQYYFRNTSSSFASSDISLNYTYYFGGN
ncbi:hypothetical protein [Helicobacter sp. 11S02629-2]|uniref:hypothetical protein n=1 Tax=Helicobacter sp. 11S02629-2 TaxID=1476195 RepID=UPI000BA5A49C|nr:hypothetical protein [Helicobacter sp. 11S02629-2]PAF45964.1 hypothetical protein BKH40_00705 [Helicobacter sp. 11S02629-2]